MKKVVLGKLGACVLGLLVWSSAAQAQDKVEASIGADVVSNYEWRGQDLGGAAVQPSIGLSYKGFTLGAWGSVALDKSDNYSSELDLTLGYSSGGFSVSITDYYALANMNFGEERYFQYGSHSTSHVFEATLGYDFGPFALAWSTNIAGADYYTSDDKRAYSSYLQATAPFTLGGVEFEADLGVSPWETAYYGNGGFAVVNLGLSASKEVKISDFKLPVFAKVGVNPNSERAFVVLGVTL